VQHRPGWRSAVAGKDTVLRVSPEPVAQVTCNPEGPPQRNVIRLSRTRHSAGQLLHRGPVVLLAAGEESDLERCDRPMEDASQSGGDEVVNAEIVVCLQPFRHPFICICGILVFSLSGNDPMRHLKQHRADSSATIRRHQDLPYLLSMMDKLSGPETYNHYPVGWAHAMDSPMQWTKQVASHFGGTRNGLVISWPKRIKAKEELRSQFHHIIDIVPTILEAAGVPMPVEIDGVKQRPLEGVSMVYTFDDAKAKDRHTTQYFELVGNRGIYHDGWMACTTPLRLPWVTVGAAPSPDDFKWELYHVAADFSQANDLAAKNPEKLKELQGVFDGEAKKYNVYPLDSHGFSYCRVGKLVTRHGKIYNPDSK